MIVIVDYGMGNIGSIEKMLKKLGYESSISSDSDIIAKASKLIMPGVGSFDQGISYIQKLEIGEALDYSVQKKKVPILGICLGMQLMTLSSEEGTKSGMGWINAITKKFHFLKEKLPVPHMGWNTINIRKESRLFQGMTQQENRFYFVHSYAIECQQREDILSETHYGYSFCSAFEKENIIGVQFHPEKSHIFGLSLFKNFLRNY